MNKIKFRDLLDSCFSEDGTPAANFVTAVPFLDEKQDGMLAYLILSFPQASQIDEMTQQMIRLADKMYHYYSCPIHCLMITTDLALAVTQAIMTSPTHPELFKPGRISFDVFNIPYIKIELDDKMKCEHWLSNLEVFVYVYGFGVTEQLESVLNTRQINFLNDDWTGFFFDEAKLKKIGKFLYFEEKHYN